MKNNGTTPTPAPEEKSSLRVVRLSNVRDPRPAVAAKLGITNEDAGKLTQAHGHIQSAERLLFDILGGKLSREQRQGSVEWRAQLAADLLKEEQDDDDVLDEREDDHTEELPDTSAR